MSHPPPSTVLNGYVPPPRSSAALPTSASASGSGSSSLGSLSASAQLQRETERVLAQLPTHAAGTTAAAATGLPSHLQMHATAIGGGATLTSRTAPPRPSSSVHGTTAPAGGLPSAAGVGRSLPTGGAAAASISAYTAASPSPSLSLPPHTGTPAATSSVLDHTLPSYKGSPARRTPATHAGAAAPTYTGYTPRASGPLMSPQSRANAVRGGSVSGSDAGSHTSSSSHAAVSAPSIVPRGAEDAELLPLCYGSAIVLRVCTGKFIAVEDAHSAPPSSVPSSALSLTGAAPSTSPSPSSSRRVHGASPSSWCTFTLLHADNPSSTGEVQFQHSVALLTPEGCFLSAEGGGEPSGTGAAMGGVGGVVEEESSIGAFRRSLDDARCKWTLLSGAPDMLVAPPSGRAPPFQRAKGGLKIFDRVLLRSCRSKLLGIVAEADVSGRLDHSTSLSDVGGHCVLRLARANLPLQPDWVRVRGAALGLNPEHAHAHAHTGDDASSMDFFNSLPPESQEQLLLDDVLSALLGMEGKFIRQVVSPASSSSSSPSLAPGASQKVSFVPSPLLRDSSLLELLGRILPAAGAYVSLNSFILLHSRWEYGMVAHALVAALRAYVQEYMLLVAQIEFQHRSGKLTLLRAWYYVQPSLHALLRLEHLCVRARGASGGALLNVLHSAMSSAGDAATTSLYQHLLSAAAVPYFSMLRLWLTQGVLKDPYDEFQISSDSALRKENLRRDFNDTYWEERFATRSGHVPVFLRSAGMAEKILTTGKYLNVIRECGKGISAEGVAAAARGEEVDGSSSDAADADGGTVLLSYSPSERDYLDPIERLYAFASRALLDLLLNSSDLLGRLRSIKRFFLLAQGDFYTHWMDLTAEELSKPSSVISPHRISSLLTLAIRSTRALGDPYHEDVSASLQPYSLVQRLEAIHNPSQPPRVPPGQVLTGFESITLGYRVGWPLSLVLSKKTLTKYQLLFRHLYSIRHTERLLTSCWGNHQSARGLELGRAYHASFALRHRMLHLFHSLAYYMLAEVLDPSWHRLEASIASARTVDDVLHSHSLFLDGALKACLLTNQALLKSMHKLIVTARHFAEHAELTMNSGAAGRRMAAAAGMGGDSDEEEEGGSQRRHRRTGSSLEDDAATGGSRRVAPSLQQRADAISFRTRVTLAAISDPHHQSTIESQCRTFDAHLADLLTQLKAKAQQASDAHFANLLQRLDYNGWYALYFQRNPPQSTQQQAQRGGPLPTHTQPRPTTSTASGLGAGVGQRK